LWNHFDNDGDRTNNNFEGYNYKLLCYFAVHHNLWRYIEKIQGEESAARSKLVRLIDGTLIVRKRLLINKDRAISILKDSLLVEEISMDEFIDKIRWIVQVQFVEVDEAVTQINDSAVVGYATNVFESLNVNSTMHVDSTIINTSIAVVTNDVTATQAT
jgi:hypothetical protein